MRLRVIDFGCSHFLPVIGARLYSLWQKQKKTKQKKKKNKTGEC